MKNQSGDQTSKMLSKSLKLLIAVFTIISMLGIVLFGLSVMNKVPVIAVIKYAMIGVLAYLFVLCRQFRNISQKVSGSIHWHGME